MPSTRVMRIIDTNYEMGDLDSGGWQPRMSFSDEIFGFLEEGELGSRTSQVSEDTMEDNHNLVMEEEEDEKEEDGKENVSSNQEEEANFWETQHQLLQATLCRTSPLESRIRSIAKEAIRELQASGTLCGCGRPMVGGCRNCLMAEVAGRLRDSGFDCAICESKWRNCPDIPSGEHTFLDVIDHSSSGKKRETRVIIELNFRAEFEMAKANEEYNQLVRRLPEVFVGKVERLQTAIKIVCSAAKRCMKEKRMHMGPWRRQRYMQAKWLGTCYKRTTPVPSTLPMGFSGRLPKPKASMLTVDLLDSVAGFRRTAVEVV